MPEIKFSAEKAGRWLDRIEKRLGKLPLDDQAVYRNLRALHTAGKKFDSQQAKALWDLERRV